MTDAFQKRLDDIEAELEALRGAADIQDMLEFSLVLAGKTLGLAAGFWSVYAEHNGQKLTFEQSIEATSGWMKSAIINPSKGGVN